MPHAPSQLDHNGVPFDGKVTEESNQYAKFLIQLLLTASPQKKRRSPVNQTIPHDHTFRTRSRKLQNT